MPKTKTCNKNPKKQTRSLGWSTSDAYEIERRRVRGLNEPSQISSQTQDDDFFGVYRVDSDNGQAYRVEIRSLAEPINSCNCPDHRINGLGTCKHIEATLCQLQYRRKRAFKDAADRGSPYIEVYLDRRDHQARIGWPKGGQRHSKANDLLAPFFGDDKILAGDPLDKLPVMLRRRKGEVEGQLPGRTVSTYFVPMHKEQMLRYMEYEMRAARLAAMAKKRPLKKEEMEQFQRYLACMRMLCDTPYILDQNCCISPKLKELGNILQELMEDDDRKIIIFSEWQRMLELMELHGEGEQQTLLVVADRLDDALQSALSRQLNDQFPDQTPQLKLLDRDAFATIRQLIEAGILSTNQDTARTLYRATAENAPKDDEHLKRLKEACNHLARGEHKRRMAKVLKEGGFSTEALAPIRDAVETALQALALWQDQKSRNAAGPGVDRLRASANEPAAARKPLPDHCSAGRSTPTG